MADKRITDLLLISSGNISSNDVLPIVDVVADVTNKVEVNQLKSYILSGVSDNYVTGGTYSNGTITLNRQNGNVIIGGLYTGGTFVGSVTDDGNGLVYIDNTDPYNPIVFSTGVTTDNITIIGTGLNNNPISLNPNYSSLSDLGFEIRSKPTKIINQNVLIPEDVDVTYNSPLTLGGIYTLTVPISSTLTIV